MTKRILSDQDVEDMDGFDTDEVVSVVESKVLEAVAKWMEKYIQERPNRSWIGFLRASLNRFKQDFGLDK